MKSAAPSNAHNWPLLAALRFFLAMVVMAEHTQQLFPSYHPLPFLVPFSSHMAVWAFFVVSGYSICHSITTKPEGFYGRRIDRIYPVFFVCYLLALVPLAIVGLHPEHATAQSLPPSFWNMVLNAFPIQTVAIQTLPSNPAAWSLGLECFFYALAPWFIRLDSRMVWKLLGVGVVFHLFRSYIFNGWVVWDTSPVPVMIYLWPWLLGWKLYQERENLLLQRYAIGAACLLAAMQVNGPKFAVATMAITVAVLLYGHEWVLPERWARVALYGGELSYPLYLAHMPVVAVATVLLPDSFPAGIIMLAALLLSVVIYHAIDKPLRKRHTTRRKQLVTAHISP